MRAVFQKLVNDHFSAKWSPAIVLVWLLCFKHYFLMKHAFAAGFFLWSGPTLFVHWISGCILIAGVHHWSLNSMKYIATVCFDYTTTFGEWKSWFCCCVCLPQNCVASSLHVLIVRDYPICSIEQRSGTIILVRSKWLGDDDHFSADHFSAQNFPGAFGARRSF